MAGYVAIGAALVFFAYAVYAQAALSRLMDFVRDRPDLLTQTGRVSDLYFIADLPMVRYGFVHYLYRHPVPPPEIAQAFPDYARLRRISNIAFGLHIVLGMVIVAGVVLSVLGRPQG